MDIIVVGAATQRSNMILLITALQQLTATTNLQQLVIFCNVGPQVITDSFTSAAVVSDHL